MATPTSSNGLNTAGSSAVKVQIGRDASVESLGQKPVAANPDTSTMGVQYQPTPIVVKQTDHNALEGSNKGDHRSPSQDTAKASLDRAADNGGPRKDVGQFKGSKFESQPSTQSFVGNLADSDSGN